jgi:hypothetical protein
MRYLLTLALISSKEFSGFGFCRRNSTNDIEVYDFVLLDIGTETFTEIPSRKVIGLSNRPDAESMRVWIHRHPVNGWSGMDERTIQETPLGGIPQMISWSVSMVLTPKGWIGRIDNYITHKTKVLEVEPQAAKVYTDYQQILTEKYLAEGEMLMQGMAKYGIPLGQMSFSDYLKEQNMTVENLIASGKTPEEALCVNEGYVEEDDEFDEDYWDGWNDYMIDPYEPLSAKRE